MCSINIVAVYVNRTVVYINSDVVYIDTVAIYRLCGEKLSLFSVFYAFGERKLFSCLPFQWC